MMRELRLIVFFVLVALTVYSQEKLTGKLILNADLAPVKKLPLKVLIEKSGIGNYNNVIDTCKITGQFFSYQTLLAEPEFLKVTFYWQNGKLTSTSFWVTPSVCRLVIGQDLVPVFAAADQSDLAIQINHLEKEVLACQSRSDSLVKTVSYENQKVEDAEKRIDNIRDSVDNVIDEDIYKKYLLLHLNSPVGLYALCKYAERPYEDQRIKSQPEKIEILLNTLNPHLRQLPSAKILFNKLVLAKKMSAGNLLKDISLPDTAGKIFKISDFKGKYVLVDFWASWCIPCREENPRLIRAYQKYKNSGFQIISISTDKISSKIEWLEAIEKDHINLWPQLNDFNNLSRETYGIRFIPANYLIDPQGVIIARNLRGTALDKALMKIFQQKLLK